VNNNQNPGGTNPLFRLAGAGASIAFGAMVASLFALKSSPDGFSFELNIGAVLAFLIAAPFAWYYWRMVARMAVEKAPERRKRKFVIFSIGIVIVGVFSFLYPLKFIPAEKRQDVFIGLTLAAACITGVGVVMWKVMKFLDADLKKTEQEERRDNQE
jgi:Sec-independent protein secretion pathway component TatC